ncbi:ABC transporter ATP-binding protein [Polynucleobacter sp. es-GGE-1]|jgi:branched-chain amino acid transport system ATP-binding protein|uniref:ABC transporter ATP-binding protein n=1 Tax=unclassified Polynucleobacter TaxID=2640945 RepID=UPI001C0C996F|nr:MULTISPECIES: ABC transporter ATP-binding protein [unclassified Polynucleobacter]MBU3635026.1 ABC transporter ATP-binding protein [Polynucleobacter sp. es-GGE-1]MEA9599369.1 ABC transporter ATP-binding protein [Polynucleobacter sp. AP-Sanab-80-C2]
MLRIENLNAWYDRSHVLQGISLEVNKGEIVTLMGRNGAGKTTTLRSLMGLLSKRQGKASIDGISFLDLPAHERFHLGLAYVPEDRRIVPGLTVKENLELGVIAQKSRGDMSALVDEIAETFPRLKERLQQDGTSMSGGEQQMLAIARAMIAKPKVILLDEPSEGIMPVLVEEMFELFAKLKQQGLTILLVEQNVQQALRISDRAYILDQGEIVFQDTAQNLLNNDEIQQKYCAV